MDRYGQYVRRDGGVRRSAASCRRAVPREPRRPSGEPNISGDWAPEQVVMVDPRGAGGGLVPLSTVGQAKPGERGRGGGARGAAARPPGRGSTAAPS